MLAFQTEKNININRIIGKKRICILTNSDEYQPI